MLAEIAEPVITALNDQLLRTGVLTHCVAIVEHLVTGGHEHEVALEPTGRDHLERFELTQMLLGELILGFRVKIFLRTKIRSQADMRRDCGIDQYRTHAESLGEPGRVVAAERAADRSE